MMYLSRKRKACFGRSGCGMMIGPTEGCGRNCRYMRRAIKEFLLGLRTILGWPSELLAVT